MSNWEYKIISSGKGGFASPALMEKFLNDLGQENWEIISFHQPADNALAFHGLARRSTQKDWTLEDAAKAAARAEADKLRAEFEAKFKAGAGQAAPEEPGETFLADEKTVAGGDLRRLRDTSRDDDLDAPEAEEGAAPKDEWDKLAEEDELPTFFDALRPHMRRNQRGPGMSVGLDMLAKKWSLDESDLKTALVECGLQIPADENAKPVYAEYEGELYWVNINRRGEIWINLRDKPQPVFRVVQAKRLEGQDEPAAPEAAGIENGGGNLPPDGSGSDNFSGQQAFVPREQRPQNQPRHEHPQEPRGPKTFLDKIRGMMRRNRRGHGMSGSFQYLTKALKTDEAGLLAQLGEHGLALVEGGQPVETVAGDFTYWLNKNQRGEIWINAELKRKDRGPRTENPVSPGPDAASGEPQPAGAVEAPAPGAEGAAPGASSTETPAQPSPGETNPAPVATLPPENTLTAVRLLMEPKKRGEGVTALVSELATKLEKTSEVMATVLAAAGLTPPDSPKGKPTFAEHGGELYWLNVSAKGELWLNAKPVAATKKARGKKSAE
ncbi:hypothetical protein Verru16b_01582 [Lacunisphaera limnophila]|uniref:DUF4177 domain-containing protein n=1 Tax=Lacunisphaera limnophila TaxID=1838286 RepID=A0A1D8AUG8_9BACT|nr:hypothetical protein [Lacunisphaera limnophila]AOS44520.1 hypothetical protein Verru16b_01582 [Lacunisphaera limnophila]